MSDGIVTLIRNSTLSENADLSISQAECFDIMVGNKFVGVISYRYHGDLHYIDYGGNINYRIIEKERGHGYAKRALKIMLNILKYNTKFDEPLYVASTTYNDSYLDVAKTCGGKLIYEGLVPDNLISPKIDQEMKNIKLYEFVIEKERKKENDRHKVN